MSDPSAQAALTVETAERLVTDALAFEGLPVKDRADNRRNYADGIARLRVKSVNDDHLVCRTWDGTTEGTTDINVAKPYVLRKTPYHGKTITFNGVALTFTYTNGFTRTVAKSGGSETQIIIPAYTGTGTGYGGEEIYAAFAPTGLKINAGQSNEEIIGLTDMNYDGRMWCKQ